MIQPFLTSNPPIGIPAQSQTLLQNLLHLPTGSSPLLTLAFVTLLGLTLGSFLNVVIYRGKKNLSVRFPERSFCPNCNTSLSWRENIPLFSYILQYGKCRHCKQTISPIYPLVELAYGIIAPILWLNTTTLQEFLIYMTFASTALPAALIDLKTYRLPDHLTLGGTFTILCLCLPTASQLAERTSGALVAFLVMGAVYYGGKLAFKTKKTQFQKPVPTRWVSSPKECYLQLAEETQTLEETEKISKNDLFDSDLINPQDAEFLLEGTFEYTNPPDETKKSCTKIRITQEKTEILDSKASFQEITLEGHTKTLKHPSLPMGWGDVKLMALCGATLGPWAAFQGLTLAAFGGLVFLVALRIIAQIEKKPKPDMIAFGPWIIAGNLTLLFLLLTKN